MSDDSRSRDDDALVATKPADGDATLRRAGAAPGDPTTHGAGVLLGGRYELRALLGQGGMGRVYRAWDAALAVEVALKFVRHDLVGSDGLARLRAEVLLAQKVTHPNVCRTYDLEELDGERVVKMEYVAGETLADRVRRGPLPVEEALAIARVVAAALEAAHAQGVVHCDLKPSNILVENATGRVVLMDFGLARAAAHPGEAAGTPAYMPPEQAAGRDLDGRADLYALGCTLHELLTGEPPYPASSPVQAAARHATDPIPDPRRARPDVPQWLVAVEQRLLAKDPAGRHADAGTLRRALDGPPQPAWRRATPWLALSLALVAATAVVARLVLRPRRAWRPHVVDRAFFDENAEQPRFSPDGRWLAYPASRDGAWRIWLEALDPNGPAARAITPPDHDANRIAWAEDGRSIYFSDSRPRVERVDVATGAITPVATGARVGDVCRGELILLPVSTPGQPASVVARSASGVDRVIARTDGTARVYDATCDRDAGLVFYSSGKRAGTVTETTSDVYVVPLAGGAARALTHDHRSNRDLAWVPGSHAVVYSSSRGGGHDLWVLSPEGGDPLPLTSGSGHDFGPAVSPDGRTLIYDDDLSAMAMYAISVDDPGKRRRLTQLLDDVAGAWPTPDQRALVMTYDRRGVRRVVVRDLASDADRVLGEGDLATPGSDGREVFYAVAADAPGRVRIEARPITGGSPRRVTEVEGQVRQMAAGGDGRLMLSLLRGSEWSAWSVAESGGAARLESSEGGMTTVTPGGRWRVQATPLPVGAHVTVWSTAAAASSPVLSLDVRRFFVARDGESLYYKTASELRRRWFSDGRDERVVSVVLDMLPYAVSPDGRTVYAAIAEGLVRRMMVDNFADAPRP